MLLPLHSPNGSQTVLVVLSHIVGMQASQQVLLQTNFAPSPAAYKRARMAVVVGCLGLVASVSEPYWSILLATGSGAVVGLSTGSRGVRLLRESRLKFQRYQALRSMMFTLATVCGLLMEREGITSGMAMALALWGLGVVARESSIGSSAVAGGGQPSAMLVLGGILSSLVYRNDVNWVRSSMADLPSFESVHVALVVMSASQAVAGMAVTHFVLAKRHFWSSYVSRESRKVVVALLGSSGFALGLGSLAAYALDSVVGQVFVAMPVAVIVGVTSGFVHVIGLSWVPYVGGTLAAAGLLLALRAGLDPGSALLGYLSLLQVLLAGAIGSKLVTRGGPVR